MSALSKRSKVNLGKWTQWYFFLLHKKPPYALSKGSPPVLFIFSCHYHRAAGAKQPNGDFLHKHRETSMQLPNSRAGELPLYFSMACLLFHKYLIQKISADICLQARGRNMQSNCEILINPRTNMWERSPGWFKGHDSVFTPIARNDKARAGEWEDNA